jgi:hypothetical protein
VRPIKTQTEQRMLNDRRMVRTLSGSDRDC